MRITDVTVVLCNIIEYLAAFTYRGQSAKVLEPIPGADEILL